MSGGMEADVPAVTPDDDKVLANLRALMQPPKFENPYVKAILYGEMGSSKSTTAGTAGERILWLDAGEQGYTSLMNHGLLDNVVDVIELNPYRGYAIIRAVAEKIAEGKLRDFDCLVIDTWSTVLQEDIDAMLHEKTVEARKARPNAPEVDLPSWDEFNRNAARTRRVVRELMRAPINVVLTSQHRDDEDKSEGGKKVTRPWMPRQGEHYTMQPFHLVAFLDNTEGEGSGRKYTIQFHPTERVKAKCRIRTPNGPLPTMIEQKPDEIFDLSRLFALWAEQAKRTTTEEENYGDV